MPQRPDTTKRDAQPPVSHGVTMVLPDHEEVHGDRHLLVWGELGQWLVLDHEARELIQLLAQNPVATEALRLGALRAGRPLDGYALEAAPLLAELTRRGISRAAGVAASPPPPEPLRIANLTFNVTNRCNLACPWCYNQLDSRRAAPEVPVDAVMDWLAAGHAVLEPDASFFLLGGEPTLCPERVMTAVRRGREAFGGELLMSTNGTRADAALLDCLAQARVTVQVSLDSPVAERHDAVRGSGVFAQALATIGQLQSRGIRTVLSMVLTREALSDMEPYFDLALQLKADEVRFIPWRRLGSAREQASDLRPDLMVSFDRLEQLLSRRPEIGRLLGRDFFSVLLTVCRHSRQRGSCGIGRRVLFVDADGSLYPCPNHVSAAWCCGHVSRTPLASLLATAPALQLARADYALECLTRCRSCAFRFWCAGDCRAEAAVCGGDARAPSPYCAALRELMPRMMWLLAEDGALAQAPPGRSQPWG